MRCRALHTTRFNSPYQNGSRLFEAHGLFKRSLKQLLYNILPTLFVLLCFSLVTLYISDLISQARLRTVEPFYVAQSGPN